MIVDDVVTNFNIFGSDSQCGMVFPTALNVTTSANPLFNRTFTSISGCGCFRCRHSKSSHECLTVFLLVT
jgi:hypothetical protein